MSIFERFTRRLLGRQDQAQPVTVEPTGVFTPADIPTPEAIVEALLLDQDGKDAANAGNRMRRQAAKILRRLPAGIYGPRIVWHEETAPTVDLDAVRARYALLGEDVPMKVGVTVKHRPASAAERLAAPIPARPVLGEEPAVVEDWVSGIFAAYRPASLAG